VQATKKNVSGRGVGQEQGIRLGMWAVIRSVDDARWPQFEVNYVAYPKIPWVCPVTA
jgi:hypothetical protein